ncbi:unnamed protein product [Discosporangium mesarthrocarpum]
MACNNGEAARQFSKGSGSRMLRWIAVLLAMLIGVQASLYGQGGSFGRPRASFAPSLSTYQRRTHFKTSAITRGEPIIREVVTGPYVNMSGRGALLARLVGDTFAAALASLMVSPFISIVDRAIIQCASGGMTMSASVGQGLACMFRRPSCFVTRPDFLCTWGLYAITCEYRAVLLNSTLDVCTSVRSVETVSFCITSALSVASNSPASLFHVVGCDLPTLPEDLAANVISTAAREVNQSDAWPKFFGTTAVNMPGSIAKDQALTKLFGSLPKGGQVPAASFALFTVRDVATMAAAFTLPTPMSDEMQKRLHMKQGWADGISQLLSPSLVQVFSTPIHILGLDLYNHPGASVSSRAQMIGKTFGPAIVLRVGRIGAAFGIGGIGNTAIRSTIHRLVDGASRSDRGSGRGEIP